MIVVCPSCATRYDLPWTPGPQGSVVRCQSCGFSWLEGNAVEIADASGAPEPSFAVPALPPETHVSSIAERIAKAAQEAAEAKAEERRRKHARQRAWGTLAAAAILPVAFGYLFADVIQDRLPRTQHVYALLGMPHAPAFELSKLDQQNLLSDGTRVLAVKGEVLNRSSSDRTAPGLRFELEDKKGKVVYAWTLPAVAARPMRAGEMAPFVTRVASPPLTAVSLKISFATRDELALNAGHENGSGKQSGSRNAVQ
ncbi:MAG: zinc-ribbon domain-containing protein [Hyphomicrobiales bacterium]